MPIGSRPSRRSLLNILLAIAFPLACSGAAETNVSPEFARSALSAWTIAATADPAILATDRSTTSVLTARIEANGLPIPARLVCWRLLDAGDSRATLASAGFPGRNLVLTPTDELGLTSATVVARKWSRGAVHINVKAIDLPFQPDSPSWPTSEQETNRRLRSAPDGAM